MYDKSNENRTSFLISRTKYSRSRQKAKRRFKYDKEKNNFKYIAKKQPRKFWKSLKKCNKKTNVGNNDISID